MIKLTDSFKLIHCILVVKNGQRGCHCDTISALYVIEIKKERKNNKKKKKKLLKKKKKKKR